MSIPYALSGDGCPGVTGLRAKNPAMFPDRHRSVQLRRVWDNGAAWHLVPSAERPWCRSCKRGWVYKRVLGIRRSNART